MEELRNHELIDEGSEFEFEFDASAEDFLMSADICSSRVI